MVEIFEINAFSPEGFAAANPLSPNTKFRKILTNLTVIFIDESEGNPLEWHYDFGDGTSSEEQNPIHKYAAEGNYIVNLTATNVYGYKSYSETIAVTIPKPIKQGIRDVKISKRYSDCSIGFTLNFIPPDNSLVSPTNIFDYGDEIQFNINDKGKSSGVSIVTGIVQTIETSNAQNNTILAITGRTIGYLLVRQPFNFDCTTEGNQELDTITLLEMILGDTGIKIGRGQTPLSTEVKYNTKGDSPSRYCGKFKTKKEAIDQLFAQYVHLSGVEAMRWYVDSGGYLRWFERTSKRANKLIFFQEDNHVVDIKIKGNAENIINDVEGYGGDQSDIYYHGTDEASIQKFGRQIGESIKDTKLRSMDEVQKVVNKQLKQKAWPFYTATLNLSDYYSVDAGEKVQFPGYPGHEDRIFTVVDVDVAAASSKNETKINLTTDETVISIINQMEIIETVAAAKADEAKSEEAIVVGKDPDDPTKILVQTIGSKTVQAARTTKSGSFGLVTL
jgi:PKD repeat protein